jgi:hypothetical protein
VEHIRSREYFKIYDRVLGLNFAAIEGFEADDRLFNLQWVMDQFTHNHLLPTYLCKITNPDQSLLDFDEDGFPIRGIRTFGEIAHYVRCIPYQSRDTGTQDSVWCSPDFTTTIKIGTEEDHALLMASLFRTVKHEDQSEFVKWSKVMKEARTSKKLKEKEELLNVQIEKPSEKGEGGETKEGNQEEEQPTTTGGAPTTKAGGIGGMGLPGGKSDKKEDEETIDDRVFVCMGKATDGTEKRQIWVMTISRDFEEVIFWEVKNHKHWVLKGRIQKGQKKFMEAYFNPIITKDEREQIKKNREHRLATSMAESMANMEEPPAKKGGAEEESGSGDDDDKSDDEGEEDSNFTNDIEKIINYSDMDQSFKGENINFIGQIDALGVNKKQELRDLNYAELEPGGAAPEKPMNKFFAAKEKQRRQNEEKRKDKHLLPVEPKDFKDPKAKGQAMVDDKKEWDGQKLPFQQVDIIFNHKNVWANL